MKSIKYIAFVIVLFFVGCNEDQFSQIKTIELPEHTPRLAVTAKFSDNFSPNIFVSHSQKLLDDNEYEVIDGATVNLYKGDDLLMDFTYDEFSRNYLPTSPMPTFEEGVTYRMEASASGYEPIMATQELPKNCEIVSVDFKEDAFITEWGEKMSILEVEIKDDGSTDNYYSLEGTIVGTFPTGEPGEISLGGYSDDPLMEYGYDEEYTPDATFNGGNYVMRFLVGDYYDQNFQVDQGGSVEKLVVAVYSYTKEYYQYDVSVSTFEDSQDVPFVEPVLISTN